MAKLVYGLNQSLDGYVDHMKLGPPVPAAFRHFVELVRGLTGVIYGRRMYDIMRYWTMTFPIGTPRPRLRGGVAEQAEVGRVAFAQLSWS